MESFAITYRFELQDGKTREFCIPLDSGLNITSTPEDDSPDWTVLSFMQCAVCPLDPREHRHCPPAVHLARVVEAFDGRMSHDPATITVSTPVRSYAKEGTVQDGLGALTGVIMTTAGCPHLRFLRPMVRFHLPFATIEETEYRMVTMYLFVQYLRMERGKSADWGLEGLTEIYARVEEVNAGFAERIRKSTRGDAGVNSLVLLDCFAKFVPMAISSRMEEYEELFSPYLT